MAKLDMCDSCKEDYCECAYFDEDAVRSPTGGAIIECDGYADAGKKNAEAVEETYEKIRAIVTSTEGVLNAAEVIGILDTVKVEKQLAILSAKT